MFQTCKLGNHKLTKKY